MITKIILKVLCILSTVPNILLTATTQPKIKPPLVICEISTTNKKKNNLMIQIGLFISLIQTRAEQEILFDDKDYKYIKSLLHVTDGIPIQTAISIAQTIQEEEKINITTNFNDLIDFLNELKEKQSIKKGVFQQSSSYNLQSDQPSFIEITPHYNTSKNNLAWLCSCMP